MKPLLHSKFQYKKMSIYSLGDAQGCDLTPIFGGLKQNENSLILSYLYWHNIVIEDGSGWDSDKKFLG